MSTRAAYVGLYGNISIMKGWCERCQSYSFVKKGLLQCCDTPCNEYPEKFKRECAPEDIRRSISPTEKRAQLDRQNNRCLYCEREFNTHVFRYGKAVRLNLVWDHFVPFAYSQNNHSQNYVAACHVCNGIKSDHMFQTVEEAAAYILTQREAKGYTL